MPSRIVQTLCSALFLIILYFVDKTEMSSLWILIPAGILVAAAFTLGPLVNSWWYARYPPQLNAYELSWLRRFVLFIPSPEPNALQQFSNQLALELREKEFISMSEKDIPEEIKMMALAPAVRLKLVYTDKAAEHYRRIVFYHHAFATPEQDYFHLSETQHEDGVIILASDALEAAYLKPDNYFNTALYEWCTVFVLLRNIAELIQPDYKQAWEIINKIISTDTESLLKYLRQPNADTCALLCYCYVMYPEKIKTALPELYNQLKKMIE